MFKNSRTFVHDLIDSTEGVHLTAYLAGSRNAEEQRRQLQSAIARAEQDLSPVLSPAELESFLEPVKNLLADSALLGELRGHVGIFRNSKMFRVLSIPTEVEFSCQVASSFHVKPLLRWLQGEREFMLLGIEDRFAHLYWGTSRSIRLVDSVMISLPEESAESFSDRNPSFLWLDEWIKSLTKKSKPPLFLAGRKDLTDRLYKNLSYKQKVKTPAAPYFKASRIVSICALVRQALAEDSRASIEKSLDDFRVANDVGRTHKNLFQIARAVVNGKVKKLVVTDEISLFGNIDKKTGRISLHPSDLNHEDDDVLDDLAQMVLSQGGQVIIANLDEIPDSRPILAIVDEDALEKQQEQQGLEMLEERFG